VVKRINRDAPISQETAETNARTAANLQERVIASKIQQGDGAEMTNSHTTRPSGVQSLNGPKDAPAGPRNPATRGHRLSEDPNSRPPPSAIMPPPVSTQVSTSQDLRSSVLQQQHDRHRLSTSDKDITMGDAGFASDNRKGDSLRHIDSPRTESRRKLG
jgi:hypothetical protein